MTKLENARQDINRIDKEMAKLFEERMQACAQIAAYKKENGLSVKDSAREAELIAKNKGLIEDSALTPYYTDFLKGVIDVSCHYQTALMSGMKVTYCGTEGAFAYLAAKKMFPTATLYPFSDFASAYAAVERGEYDCAVLPLENSYAGEVGEVADLMFSGSLSINQIVDIPIAHALLGLPGASAADIRTVISHPQALDQCENYIRARGLKAETYSNTALAARYVAEQTDKSVAAIASEESAALFGLTVLDAAVNDERNNTTRFAAFSRSAGKPLSPTKREDENFILVFTVQNEAGSLAKALNILGAHGFNMRNLRSRPMKDLQWNYYFYIEAEGNVHTVSGREMLQELSAVCAKLKLVGSYYADNVQ